MDILKKIEKYREEEEKLRWVGTFRDYLLKLLKKSHGWHNQHILGFII